IEDDTFAPPDAVVLKGWTVPGLANVHSHAFQRLLRGEIESGAGDFWEWRDRMYRFTEGEPADYVNHARLVFREMLEAGITAVGEFHYLHGHGNELGEALIDAAREEGIRITLLDACYLRAGLDGRPLEAEQLSFSDGDADSWARRVDELSDADGVRIGAAIHSVRAVDAESMRIVATYARERKAPLHIHLAEQPAEVDECLEVERCTPVALLEREGILGPDLTAIHAIHVNEGDVAILGQNQVSICACPTTERDLGDRVAATRSGVGGLPAEPGQRFQRGDRHRRGGACAGARPAPCPWAPGASSTRGPPSRGHGRWHAVARLGRRGVEGRDARRLHHTRPATRSVA